MTGKKLVEIGNMRRNDYRFEEAYRYYLEAAMGDREPEAMLKLGLLYLYGEGVRTDYDKAFHYAKLYFDLTGQIEMVWRFVDMKDDVLPDRLYAKLYADLLDHMISNGSWEAYIYLADEYRDGRIYPQSYEKMAECYQKAREHGSAMASECLAELYFKGIGVEQDYRKAYELFTEHDKAASFTRPYYLGLMYKNGYFVKKDISRAIDQFREIMDSGWMGKEMDDHYSLAKKELEELMGA